MEKLVKYLLVLRYIIQLCGEGFKNPFKKISIDIKRPLAILANGPSLNIFLKEIKENSAIIDKYDFACINDFVNDPMFCVIKPKHYVLSDHMFFHETKFKERGIRTMKGLMEKVDWPMYLYICRNNINMEYMQWPKQNPNIKIICYHEAKFPRYTGLDKIRYFFYSRGLGNGEFGTVAINAIYVGITLKYNNIELYGFDHTFFDGLCVNKDNVVCYSYRHSFDGEAELKPIIWHNDTTHDYVDMTWYVDEKAGIFYGHKIMSKYALMNGVNILNCTESSLIDVYPRRK